MSKTSYSYLGMPETVINSEYPSQFTGINRTKASNNEMVEYNPDNIIIDTRASFDIKYAPTNNTTPEQVDFMNYQPPENWTREVLDVKELDNSRPTPDVLLTNDDLQFEGPQLTSAISLAHAQHSPGNYYFTADRGFLPVRDYTKDYVSDIEYAREEPAFMHPMGINVNTLHLENQTR